MILLADIAGVMYSGGAITLLAMLGVYVWLLRAGRKDVVDSPWFWATLFSGCALMGTLFVGPKYAQREAEHELRAIARGRSKVSAEQGFGTTPRAGEELSQAADGRPTDSGAERALTSPPKTLEVPLYLLIGLLSAAFIVSSFKLSRELLTPSARAKS